MLTKSPTGTWIPAYVPESPLVVAILLMLVSVVQSSTNGYDGSMVNGLNILPSYTNYFELTPAILGLQTASVFIGSGLAAPISGVVSDRLGRRPAIFWGSIVTIIGVVLQAAAQNTAMFTVARIILGAGTTITGVGGVVYLTETFSSRWRAWGVGLLNDFYGVGALIAAGITFATSQWASTWAWRLPSLIQALFSIIAIIILPFVPESPRWLVNRGRHEDARLVLAQVTARGNIDDPEVVVAYREIVETLEWEKQQSTDMFSFKQLFKDKPTVRRLLIGISAGVFSTVAGNLIAGYYLGAELATAGITDSVQQLKANIVLNAWGLVCALFGTHLCHKWGRKSTALLTQCLISAMMFIIGGLSKKYADDPEGASSSLIYGNVAVIFLFQGFYSIGWTPLAQLYPPEIFNFAMRSNGMALWQLVFSAVTTLFVFVEPIGIANVGYWMYFANAIWDAGIIVLIWLFWVETKGRTLEEIDALFYPTAHTDQPRLEDVHRGRADVREIDGSSLDAKVKDGNDTIVEHLELPHQRDNV